MNRIIREQAGVAAAISAFFNQYEIPVYHLPERSDDPRADEKYIHQLFKGGQELVICGNIGLVGTVLMAEAQTERLKEQLPMHFIRSGAALKPQLAKWPEEAVMKKTGVVAAYPVTEGGLLAALNCLAKDSPLGFRIDYDEVPTKQVTVEFCEIFDCNPWQLWSGGCVLMVTNHGYETLRAMEGLGVPCKIVGHMADNKDKLICHGEIRSCLNRPEPDDLYKVF